MRTILPPSLFACSSLCVVMMIVYLCDKLFKSSSIIKTFFISSDEQGSSSMSTSGFVVSILAMQSLCFWPPESLLAGISRSFISSSKFTLLSSSSTLFCLSFIKFHRIGQISFYAKGKERVWLAFFLAKFRPYLWYFHP